MFLLVPPEEAPVSGNAGELPSSFDEVLLQLTGLQQPDGDELSGPRLMYSFNFRVMTGFINTADRPLAPMPTLPLCLLHTHTHTHFGFVAAV